jgi:hypothetical protein
MVRQHRHDQYRINFRSALPMNCNEAKHAHFIGGFADWMSLAAAPTFAVMALLTGGFGGGAADLLCSAAQGGSTLSGMAPMYLLMSAFHSVPWLKVICRRQRDARRSSSAILHH